MESVNIHKQRLPKIYKRNGQEHYLDPIRKKLIKITPEETVRQKVVSYLIDELQVPAEMIQVEQHLSHYGIKSRRRADIVVEQFSEADQLIVPLLIIECKAPNVFLGEQPINQLYDYACAIGGEYLAVVNGEEFVCIHYNADLDSYEEIKGLPKYKDMLRGEYTVAPIIEIPPRLSLEEIRQGDNWRAYQGLDMGRDTDKKIIMPIINFWEGIWYPEHSMPVGQYKLFKLLEDYGVRNLSYGNASGGVFNGAYRSFIIEYKGSTEIVSLGISPCVTWAHQDVEKTSLNVAVDNENETHHSLQLVLDDNLHVDDDKVTFYHHGRIGISNKGSGRISELRELAGKLYPQIVDGERFNIGTLVDDHLWNLDEEDMMKLIENLISYALIRDEYRKIVKSR